MRPGTKALAKFAEEQASERLNTLRANLNKARKDPGNTGRIHDLRVSIRRFTQVLRIFKDVWSHGHYRKMRRKLRRVMDLCGAVRNCDVAMEILEAAEVPAPVSLMGYLQKRRSRAESDLSEELARTKSRVTKLWQDWLDEPTKKNQSVRSRAHQILRPLAQEYLLAGSRAAQPETPPQELHGLRLTAKRWRYSLEIFGALSGDGWEQEIERIQQVQDLLGAINDCVTTNSLLAEGGPKAEVRRSKAPLKRLLDQRLETFRAHWHKVYDSAEVKRPEVKPREA